MWKQVNEDFWKENRESKVDQVNEIVSDIIEMVREKGDQALIELAKKFDKVDLERVAVTREEIEEAYEKVSPELVEELENAAYNIQRFHEMQKPAGMWLTEDNADRVIPVIDGVFEFRYLENRGVAFGMMQGQTWLFIPITLLISALIVVMLIRSPMRKHKMFSIPAVMVMAGAIGNLIDRIAYGYVIDFLYFKLIDFPIFNFADCCVVIGACLLFLFFLFGMKEYDNLPMRTVFFGIPTKQKERDDG